LFFTHFNGLVMLLVFAPLFAWAYRSESDARALARSIARVVAPLAPVAIGAAAFVLLTWRQAEGKWAQMNPDAVERVARFTEFLAGGPAAPWPAVWSAAFAATCALAFVIGGARPARRAQIAFGAALAAQVAMYFALPLNTNTATFVSARHALLIVIFALPLLPAVAARAATVARATCGGVAVVAIVASAREIACFDREARDFDGVLAGMEPRRRVLPLVFAKGSACTNVAAFPYFHFAGYYMAARGGELARTFATVWNVPIRFRSDYARYPIREELEWAPQLVSANDVRHYDYVIVRSARPVRLPAEVRELARRGAWTLLEVAAPLDE